MSLASGFEHIHIMVEQNVAKGHTDLTSIREGHP